MHFDIDPTKEPVFKSIVYLSVPMMLEMGAQNIFNLVDTYFVSRIAYEAIGALVTSSMIMLIFISVAVGISTATGIYVATYWGAKKFSRAKLLYSNSLMLSCFVAAIFSIAIYPFIPQILYFVGLEKTTLAYAREYLSVSVAGLVLNFVFSLNNSTIRSLSLPSIALRVMILSNLLNIVFDPFFIFYIGLGIKGAAISTIVSISFGIALQLVLLYRHKIYYIGLRINAHMMKNILKKGIFASLQLFFRISSMLILIKIIGSISQMAISAYGAVIRIYQVLLFMVFGVANASFVITGQNFGAKLMHRVKKSAFLIIFLAVIFIGGLDLILYINRDFMISLFINDNAVKNIAADLMLFYAVSYPFVIASTISSRTSMALHDTKRPSMVNLFNLWFFQLPLAYFLSLKFNERGVWAAIAVSNITAFLFNFYIMYVNLNKGIK